MRGTGDVGSGGVGVVGRCSSMRSRKVGGTTRPVGVVFGGGATGAAATARGSASSALVGAGVSTAGSLGAAMATAISVAGGASTGGATTDGATSAATGSGTAGGSSSTGSSVTGTGAGLAVFTRRGGGSTGAAGLGGSGAFFAGALFLPLTTGVSAKMSPPGREIFRCRASRSTNWRATTSSIVLEALFTSIPWSRLSSAVTSWLVVPSSSATL
jgi:hypothetical protein